MVFTPGAISITPAALTEMLFEAGYDSVNIEAMIPGMTKVAFGLKEK